MQHERRAFYKASLERQRAAHSRIVKRLWVFLFIFMDTQKEVAGTPLSGIAGLMRLGWGRRPSLLLVGV